MKLIFLVPQRKRLNAKSLAFCFIKIFELCQLLQIISDEISSSGDIPKTVSVTIPSISSLPTTKLVPYWATTTPTPYYNQYQSRYPQNQVSYVHTTMSVEEYQREVGKFFLWRFWSLDIY